MGRTSRHRKRLRNVEKLAYLDDTSEIINLTKWMRKLGWRNRTKLRLANFPETGRGATSTRSLSASDTLIEIPYSLLISYTSLQKNENFVEIFRKPCDAESLTIHELLALFLVFENHHAEFSPWQLYLKTLPSAADLTLTWPCAETFELPLELAETVVEKTDVLKASFARVKYRIDSKWRCCRCKKHMNSVLTFDVYMWAYKIVNTRAVFVNPEVVRSLSDSKLAYLLSGEPVMALCPFLDMFNHSAEAVTTAELKREQGRWYFRLATGTPCRKYQQVFISYGSHSNAVLFCDYGFCLMDNKCDKVRFTCAEISGVCEFAINNVQYKFIRNLRLDTNLEVTESTVSFNLRAILYVLLYDFDYKNWKKTIFGGDFSVDSEKKINDSIKMLLNYKIAYYENELEAIEIRICWGNVTFPPQNSLKLIAYYLRCRVLFLYDLIKIHCK